MFDMTTLPRANPSMLYPLASATPSKRQQVHDENHVAGDGDDEDGTLPLLSRASTSLWSIWSDSIVTNADEGSWDSAGSDAWGLSIFSLSVIAMV